MQYNYAISGGKSNRMASKRKTLYGEKTGMNAPQRLGEKISIICVFTSEMGTHIDGGTGNREGLTV